MRVVFAEIVCAIMREFNGHLGEFVIYNVCLCVVFFFYKLLLIHHTGAWCSVPERA